MRVLFTAAHAGFTRELVPLGGGAAVANQLIAEWSRTRPFENLEVLDPSILGSHAPSGGDLVRFGERDYANFCYRFSRAVTGRVLAADPRNTAVLVNDISEGPDFAAIAAAGFPIYTIYHVDVVAYVADIYARQLMKPETMVRWYDRAPFLVPPIGRLVFEKQLQTVLHSRKIIVPSQRMRSVLESCYGARAQHKVEVLPWGAWAEDGDPQAIGQECSRLRREFDIPIGARVLLTLSRISPEKGQDLLLEALQPWNPGYPVVLIICGEAAFMQGIRFLDRLRKLAAAMRHVRVIFAGYVTGLRKQAIQRLAHLYIFPSRHESYGLTLLEALHAGLPAVCLDHHCAREIMRPEFGRIVTPPELRRAIEQLINDDETLSGMSQAARAYAVTQRFSRTASTLANMIGGAGYSGGGSSNAAV
jgi:glycosyltransferase involved in cell wall biosynthesis